MEGQAGTTEVQKRGLLAGFVAGRGVWGERRRVIFYLFIYLFIPLVYFFSSFLGRGGWEQIRLFSNIRSRIE